MYLATPQEVSKIGIFSDFSARPIGRYIVSIDRSIDIDTSISLVSIHRIGTQYKNNIIQYNIYLIYIPSSLYIRVIPGVYDTM